MVDQKQNAGNKMLTLEQLSRAKILGFCIDGFRIDRMDAYEGGTYFNFALGEKVGEMVLLNDGVIGLSFESEIFGGYENVFNTVEELKDFLIKEKA